VNWSSIYDMFGMALTRPPLQWRCNGRVAWASRTSKTCHHCEWQYSAIWREVSVFVKCDTTFRLLFCKLPQIRTSNVRKSAATFWRYGGKYYMGFVGNLVFFRAVKNFENPLRIDSYRYEFGLPLFFGTQRIIIKIVRSYHCLFVCCSYFSFFYFSYYSWWIKMFIRLLQFTFTNFEED